MNTSFLFYYLFIFYFVLNCVYLCVSQDSCVRQAVKCVKMAKLVTLQLHFLNHGQELRVINLRPAELQSAIVSLPRCYQVLPQTHSISVII